MRLTIDLGGMRRDTEYGIKQNETLDWLSREKIKFYFNPTVDSFELICFK